MQMIIQCDHIGNFICAERRNPQSFADNVEATLKQGFICANFSEWQFGKNKNKKTMVRNIL